MPADRARAPDATARRFGGSATRRRLRNREVIGCLVIEQTADSRPRPGLEERTNLLADHVGAVLSHARRQDRILFLRLWQTLGTRPGMVSRPQAGQNVGRSQAVAAVVVAALCFVPWEYRVVGKGKLMPIRRRARSSPRKTAT